MKQVRKALFVLLLVACCFSLSGCILLYGYVLGGNNDSVPKEVIIEYVQEHVDLLSTFPYDSYKNNTNDVAKIQAIKEALGQDTIVKRVSRYSPDILEFYCGGTGNVVHSTYCGFYYSEKDEPFAFVFEREARFIQTAEGVYEWESEDQERAIITERIMPKWFYYYEKYY